MIPKKQDQQQNKVVPIINTNSNKDYQIEEDIYNNELKERFSEMYNKSIGIIPIIEEQINSEEFYDNLINKDPLDIDNYLEKSAFYLYKDKETEALEYIDYANEISPNNIKVFIHYYNYYSSKDTGTANIYYEKILKVKDQIEKYPEYKGRLLNIELVYNTYNRDFIAQKKLMESLEFKSFVDEKSPTYLIRLYEVYYWLNEKENLNKVKFQIIENPSPFLQSKESIHSLHEVIITEINLLVKSKDDNKKEVVYYLNKLSSLGGVFNHNFLEIVNSYYEKYYNVVINYPTMMFIYKEYILCLFTIFFDRKLYNLYLFYLLNTEVSDISLERQCFYWLGVRQTLLLVKQSRTKEVEKSEALCIDAYLKSTRLEKQKEKILSHFSIMGNTDEDIIKYRKNIVFKDKFRYSVPDDLVQNELSSLEQFELDYLYNFINEPLKTCMKYIREKLTYINQGLLKGKTGTYDFSYFTDGFKSFEKVNKTEEESLEIQKLKKKMKKVLKTHGDGINKECNYKCVLSMN